MNARIELHDPSASTAVRRRSWSAQRRLEVAWAWASLLALIICWDAALRLDQHVSPPRVRLAHAVELERSEETSVQRSRQKSRLLPTGDEVVSEKSASATFFQ